MIGNVFNAWMDLPNWVIFATLALAFGATGLAMFCFCFRFSGEPRRARYAGVVAPFLGAPHLLFALTAVFLANDAWRHFEQAEHFLLDERDGIITLESISAALPVSGPVIRDASRAYVASVLTDEWQSKALRGSPKTAAALGELIRVAADPSITQEADSAVHGAVVTSVLKVTNARSGRLSLRNDETDAVKWSGALVLALIAQLGIAAVHVERWRAQAVALAIFTASVVTILGVIAVCERPFSGAHQIAVKPLYATQWAVRG